MFASLRRGWSVRTLPLVLTLGAVGLAQGGEPGTRPVQPGNRPAASESLSGEALAQFTRKVQPLLRNQCGAGGCHGHRGHTAFRIESIAGRTSRSATLANMAAVWRYGAGTDVAQSPLFTHATKVHPLAGGAAVRGQLRSRPLGEHQRRILLEWLRRYASDRSPSTLDGEADLARRPGRPAAGPASGGTPADRPVDPFDPQAFNRRSLGTSRQDSAQIDAEAVPTDRL